MGTPKRPKTEPKTIHKRNENQEAKRGDPRRARTHLGAILVALGVPCGSPKTPKVLENVIFPANLPFRRQHGSKRVPAATEAEKSAKRSQDDPQEGPKIDPKTTQNRYQNRPKFQCENQEGRPGIDPQTLGRDPPPGKRPRSPGRGPRRHGSGPQAPMRAVY